MQRKGPSVSDGPGQYVIKILLHNKLCDTCRINQVLRRITAFHEHCVGTWSRVVLRFQVEMPPLVLNNAFPSLLVFVLDAQQFLECVSGFGLDFLEPNRFGEEISPVFVFHNNLAQGFA